MTAYVISQVQMKPSPALDQYRDSLRRQLSGIWARSSTPTKRTSAAPGITVDPHDARIP